ncbi:hypothetical protein ANN_22225 [Periplaneta americana]|uniref:Uncharacterized protein n=1 Tax=Periplaneta americana TaxID=6978 RepID=A0ABQ8S7K1_PERAM|nr:hypothetical protein ANN_22225 [Periplaneta americana]
MAGLYEGGNEPAGSLKAIFEFVPTLVSMSGVIDLTAATFLLLKSGSSTGSGGTYTRFFTYPHRMKSHGVRSGERGGHERKPCYSDRHVLSIVGKQHR